MKSAEIRQTVLSAAAGNQNAIEYAARQEERFKEPYIRGRCAFLVHATPLVPVEVLWNVTDDEWREVMDGSHRQNKYAVNLCGIYRQPSVEGIVASIVRNIQRESMRRIAPVTLAPRSLYGLGRIGETSKAPISMGPILNFFLRFADLCEEAVQIARSDRPYLLQATITSAATAPHLRRDSGQSFLEAVAPWTPTFYNAFGIDYRR